MQKSVTITVNFKVTTEFTNTSSTVKVQDTDWNSVKDLVNDALEIDSLNDDYYKHFKVTSDNVEIPLTKKFSTFTDGTVLDISK